MISFEINSILDSDRFYTLQSSKSSADSRRDTRDFSYQDESCLEIAQSKKECIANWKISSDTISGTVMLKTVSSHPRSTSVFLILNRILVSNK